MPQSLLTSQLVPLAISNGLGFQFGKYQVTRNQQTYNLNYSYTNTHYKVITNSVNSTDAAFQVCVLNRTKSTFNAYYYTSAGTGNFLWISLGY